MVGGALTRTWCLFQLWRSGLMPTARTSGVPSPTHRLQQPFWKMALCTGKGGYQCPFAPDTRLSKSAATTSNWEIRVFMSSALNPLPLPASPPNAMSGVPKSRTRHGGRKEITKFSGVAYVYFLLSLILGQCFLKDRTWGSFLNRHWSSSWKWRFWASTQLHWFNILGGVWAPESAFETQHCRWSLCICKHLGTSALLGRQNLMGHHTYPLPLPTMIIHHLFNKDVSPTATWQAWW